MAEESRKHFDAGIQKSSGNDDEQLRLRFDAFRKDLAVQVELSQKMTIGNWEGLQDLGRGGSGTACLFGRLDANNNLRQRLVVKESICDNFKWFNPLSWAGAYDATGNRNYNLALDHSESSETFIHRKLATQAPDVILNYLGRSEVDVNQWRYRVYTELAAHKSLADVIRHYRVADNFPEHAMWQDPGRNESLPHVLIPEPFIWYVFLNLVKAAQVLESGSYSDEAVNDWKEVIHRDIKPSNVFLHEPLSGPRIQWQLYPIPKLADFDLATETTPTDPLTNNPRAFRGAGTPGFVPPDQFEWFDRKNGRDYLDLPRLSSATNVWAIGMVIWCLVHRVNKPGQPDFHYDPDESDADPEVLRGHLYPPEYKVPRPGYSSSLIDLMAECLSFDPGQRPTLRMLRARIDPKGLDAENMHFKNMRKVKPKANQPWYDNDRGRKYRLDMLFPDDYKVGFARADLPPPPPTP